MKKLFIYLSVILLSNINTFAQETLIDTFAFENLNAYNSFWGISDFNGALALGSDFNGEIFTLNENNEIESSTPIQDPIDFCHGLAWDGEYYWVAEDYNSSGASLYKISVFGTVEQTIELPQVIEGNPSGVGGLSYEDGHLWFTIYYPNFEEFPYAHAYKLNIATEEIVENIPLYGKQVYGITTYQNYIFYVTDNLNDDPEKIYVYDKAINDTIYSFPLLDPDGDSSPRGLHWFENHLYLIAKRPGGSAFQYSMLYKYQIEVPTPAIGLSIESLDFGEIVINTDSTASLTIINEGDAALEINSLATDNSAFIIEAIGPFPLSIDPGSSLTIPVTFLAQDTIEYSATINILCNDPNNQNISVNLFGTGLPEPQSQITLNSNQLDLGEVAVGSDSTQVFYIQNTGTAVLEITDILIDNEIYSFTDEQNFPILINPGEEIGLMLTVNIETAGANNGTLTIFSNSETDSQIEVYLTTVGIISSSFNDLSSKPSVKIYPNPVSNWLSLKLNDQNEIKNISLIDLNGKTIQFFDNYEQTALLIDVSNFNQGIYFINIERLNGQQESFKFLKMK